MPKNMVDVIRKSLESSQCTVSSSSSYSSRNASQTMAKQKKLQAPSNGEHYYSSSDESDEAESRYLGENSFPSLGKLNYAYGLNSWNSDRDNSPERPCTQEFTQNHPKSPSALQSQPHGENGQELDKVSDCDVISHINRHNPEDGTEGTLENDYSVVGDSSCLDVGESNYISDYLAFSDLMVHATEGRTCAIRDGDNNMFDFFLNIDSQGVTSNQKRFRTGDEETEVSSTTSMSSVLGRLLNLEFEDQFDVGDSLSTNGRPSLSREEEVEKQFKDSFMLSRPKKVDVNDTIFQAVVFDSEEAESDGRDVVFENNDKKTHFFLEDVEKRNPKSSLLGSDSDHSQCGGNQFSTDLGGGHVSDEKSDFLLFKCNCKSVEGNERCKEQLKNINVVGFSEKDTPLPISANATFCVSVVQQNIHEKLPVNQLYWPIEDMNGAQEATAVVQNVQYNILSAPESGCQDENIPNGRKKHGRRPLLRTIVKGTAIAGILFLLLHIRNRKGKGDYGQERGQYGQVFKYSESKSSSNNRRKTNVVEGIYPSQNLRL